MNEYHLISSFDHLAAKGESNGGLPATKNLIGERSHTWHIKNNTVNSGLQCFGESVHSTNYNSAYVVYCTRLEPMTKGPMVYKIKASTTADKRFKYNFSAQIRDKTVFTRDLTVDRPLNLPTFYEKYSKFMDEGQQSVPEAFDNSQEALSLLPFEATSHHNLFEVSLADIALFATASQTHMWHDSWQAAVKVDCLRDTGVLLCGVDGVRRGQSVCKVYAGVVEHYRETVACVDAMNRELERVGRLMSGVTIFDVVDRRRLMWVLEKQRWVWRVMDACLSVKGYQSLNGLKRSRNMAKKRILDSLTRVLDSLEPYKEFKRSFFDTDDTTLLQYWDRIKLNKPIEANALDRVRNFIRDVLEGCGTSRESIDRLIGLLCTDEELDKIRAIIEQRYTKSTFPQYWWLGNTSLPYMMISRMLLPSIRSYYVYEKKIGFRQLKSMMNSSYHTDGVYEATVAKKVLLTFTDMRLHVIDIRTDKVVNTFGFIGVIRPIKFIGFCQKSDSLYLMATKGTTNNVQYIRIRYIELLRKRSLDEIDPLNMAGFEVFRIGSHTMTECNTRLSDGYLMVCISKYVYQPSWKVYIYKLTKEDGPTLVKESSQNNKAMALRHNTLGQISDEPTEAFQMVNSNELVITPDWLINIGKSTRTGRIKGIVAFSLNDDSKMSWIVYDTQEENEFNHFTSKGKGSAVYGFCSKGVPCVLTINITLCKTTVYAIVRDKLSKVAEDTDSRVIQMLKKDFTRRFSQQGSMVYISGSNKLIIWHSEVRGTDTTRPKLYFKFKQLRLRY